MIVFGLIAYFFIDRGINTQTRNYVDYEQSGDVSYKVYLHDNDIYQQDYLNMGNRYITSLVDNIEFTFNYNKIFSRSVNGYYSYEVVASLIAYKDKMNDEVLNNSYILLDKKTEILNKNDLNNIDINQEIIIDFDKYKDALNGFIHMYEIDLSGYLKLSFLIDENLNFSGIKDVIEDKEIINVIIPLSYDTFRVDITNNNINKNSSYEDFSNKERVNYIFLVFGALAISIMMAFMTLVIRNIIILSKNQSKYDKELKKIFKEYNDILVGVKRFYNKKKYNLIYVDSFKELIDVYNKNGNPITYREVKKGNEMIFLITDDDNAWIYRMINDIEKEIK